MKTDFSHCQILVTDRLGEPASGATELKQETLDDIRMPIATVQFDGGKGIGDFALTLDDGGVWFLESSEIGKAQFGTNRKSTTIVAWKPRGLMRYLHAPVQAPISPGDRQIDDIRLSRSVDPLQVPGRGVVLHVPLIDGTPGLQGLKTFDIAVDNRRGAPAAQADDRIDSMGIRGQGEDRIRRVGFGGRQGGRPPRRRYRVDRWRDGAGLSREAV
nr:hypothetical protein [Burkholderia plantarii]